MRETTVHDCKIITLRNIHRNEGDLTVVESGIDVPFTTKRTYFLHNVPDGASRGDHAHKELKQLVIAIGGIFSVTLDDGKDRKTIRLTSPEEGLLIVPGIWRELYDFFEDAICLVLASELYDEDDYIRDYTEFLNYKL